MKTNTKWLVAAIAMPALLMSSNSYADDAGITTPSTAPMPAVEPAAQTPAQPPQPASASTPADPSLKPSIITMPNWLRIPTGDQINREYPERAFRQNVEGRAVIRCMVMTSGKLTECRVVSETPEGYGFGAALLNLSKRFTMRPKTKDGVPVDGATVTIPMNFRMR